MKTMFGYNVYFDEESTIVFTNEEDDTILSLNPTDLSAIYGAYMQMREEEVKGEQIKK